MVLYGFNKLIALLYHPSMKYIVIFLCKQCISVCHCNPIFQYYEGARCDHSQQG